MLLHVLFVSAAAGLDNGLARTPPMGWLSWERYGCNTDCNQFPSQCISADLYLSMADKLVDLGLSDLGYKYVNIDDCWSMRERSESGEILADPVRFPYGLKSIAEYLHSKGLKFGLYTDIGTLTCGGYPGLGHAYLESDIEKFVEWEIDSLKVDGCYADPASMGEAYKNLSQILNKTGRPVLFSCSWPAYMENHCETDYQMSILKTTCNLWRNYDDINDSWSSVRSIINFFARNSSRDTMVSASGPGHWNDPDMLLTGNPGLSISEQRAQFALWAILAAPLYISSDLRTISDESLGILKNTEVIAVNQDPLGKQGYVISESGYCRTWMRPLSGERFAILFENKSTALGPIRVEFNFSQLGWSNGCHTVKDVHRYEIVTVNGETLSVNVDESSVEMFVVARSACNAETVVKEYV